MAKRNFYDGPIFTITNYIYWFSLSNLYFMLTNILLVSFLVLFMASPTVELNAFFYLVFYIVLLPLGPSFTALLSVMGKIVRQGDVSSVTREFFRGYKRNFKQSFKMWFFQLTATFILLVDISFFRARQGWSLIVPVFYALMLIFTLVGLYVYPIISRFYLNTKDVLKLSLYYVMKKFNITVLNVVSIIAVGILFQRFPGILILFFGSVICYGLMYNERNILKEIEERVSPNPKGNSEEQEEMEKGI